MARQVASDQGVPQNLDPAAANYVSVRCANPEARFESTEVEVTGDGQGVIRGDLTIRGVTKSIEIAAQYVGGGDDPWGGFRQGFTGTTEFKPADFGMPHPVAGQTVFVTLDVEGIRQ